LIVDRLGEIVASLLVYAQLATGYGGLTAPPQIVFLPQAELANTVCHRPCPVYGWYSLDGAIYLDERLDPVEDMAARGILLHELVHVLQHAAGAFTDDIACRNWARREYQAYQVQARWLREKQVSASAYHGAGHAPWTLACRHAAGQREELNRPRGTG